jgi:hypothetical protein
VMGIHFHIGEKKIPGSVGEPTADGRSPVRTLSRTCWSGLVPPKRDGTSGRELIVTTKAPRTPRNA